MFDVKSEAHEFIGNDRNDAVSQACEFYGVEESELTVHEPAALEVYGLGGRAAIVAHPSSAPKPGSGGPRGARDGGRDGGGDRDRGRDRDRDRPAPRDREERGGRGRGERGPRRERGGRDREARGGRDNDRGATRETERESAPAVAAAAAPDSKGKATGKMGEVGDFVLGVVERMGIGPFEISETAEGEFVVYELRGAAAEEMGSGDGRAVDALQLLANQFAMRLDDDAPRIVVDAEGDAERRESFLGRLAERAARRAADSGRSVALDPMNGRDRRMVHVALREQNGIATMSIGSGRYRQVVVVPEGSPEYDEAVKSAEEAASRES